MTLPPFTHLIAVAAPLLRPNVDTDAIIPSREIRNAGKTDLADGLFAGWRYTQVGGREPDEGFVLNDSAYRGSQILLGGVNFGCGSSREHAVWALAEYGFRAIIAPSFAPIFQSNCVRNGILPAILQLEHIEAIATYISHEPQQRRLSIDLARKTIHAPGVGILDFSIAAEARQMLMSGLDGISQTLNRRAEIELFRLRDKTRRPWSYL